ncbi:tetratricopeptide repeat protein [Frankia canadensis]|nr:tetratricopeptide repeat protein [Frankia canadensis]
MTGLRSTRARRMLTFAVLAAVLGLTGSAVTVSRPEVRLAATSADAGHVPAAMTGPAAGRTSSSAARLRPAELTDQTDPAGASVAGLQDRLGRVPRDWTSWAALGLAYVEQARLRGDPTSYPRADGAFARSLALRADNDPALAGRAALAAARHDFPAALRDADHALAANPYNATAHGIRFDALVELGRYPEAWQAAQAAVDLRPDVGSLVRAAYAEELRGQTDEAASLLRRVLADATSPADITFASFHLGELARQRGDLDGAAVAYATGLAHDPSSVQLLVGRARLAAARGQTTAALADYGVAATRSPQPWIVAEYGELLEASGRPDEARRQYDLVRTTAALFRAQGVEVDVDLALFESDHGDPAAALAALTPAPGAAPHRAGVFVDDARGWALHRLGRDREALASANAALALGLHRALFSYHRGEIRAALGQPAGAITDLRSALAMDPHFSPRHSPRARTLLASLEAARR